MVMKLVSTSPCEEATVSVTCSDDSSLTEQSLPFAVCLERSSSCSSCAGSGYGKTLDERSTQSPKRRQKRTFTDGSESGRPKRAKVDKSLADSNGDVVTATKPLQVCSSLSALHSCDSEGTVVFSEDQLRTASLSCAAVIPKFSDQEESSVRLVVDEELRDVIRNLCRTERSLRPLPTYLDRHVFDLAGRCLNADIRRTCISWLMEVKEEFGLHRETLFLATTLLDRFLSCCRAVPSTHLQLVAVACMFLAAKHEEEQHPSCDDFTHVADNSFEVNDLLRMEGVVLHTLEFRLYSPTLHTFSTLFSQGCDVSEESVALGTYFLELSLLDYSFLKYTYSLVAVSALLLAEYQLDTARSLKKMELLSGYSLEEMKECAEKLLETHSHAWSDVDEDSWIPIRMNYYHWRHVPSSKKWC